MSSLPKKKMREKESLHEPGDHWSSSKPAGGSWTLPLQALEVPVLSSLPWCPSMMDVTHEPSKLFYPISCFASVLSQLQWSRVGHLRYQVLSLKSLGFCISCSPPRMIKEWWKMEVPFLCLSEYMLPKILILIVIIFYLWPMDLVSMHMEIQTCWIWSSFCGTFL